MKTDKSNIDKKKLSNKVDALLQSGGLSESVLSYLLYVKKGLYEIIDFSDFYDLSERSILDTLYLIGLASSNNEVSFSKKDVDDKIMENIKKSLIGNGFNEKDAEISANVLINYIDNSLIDLLLDEKSIILKGEKGFLDNMNMIYNRFYKSKSELLEGKISAEPKGKEQCYIVAFQYDKLISQKLAELSDIIHKYVLQKKEEGLLNGNVDFIEYMPENIHTSILTTPLSKEFSNNKDDDIEKFIKGIKKTRISEPTFSIKGVKINKNSIILETLPESAVFLEDIKLLSKNVSKSFGYIGGARGSHITLGRFVGEITDEKILSDIYDIIIKYFKDIGLDKITPKQIIAGTLVLNTQNGDGSYFKLNPIYFNSI